MTRAKELADKLRGERDGVIDLDEVASLLDRLHAIESASGEEVAAIRERHDARQAGEEPADYSQAFEDAHEDRATLLAIVQRQAGEIAELHARDKDAKEARAAGATGQPFAVESMDWSCLARMAFADARDLELQIGEMSLVGRRYQAGLMRGLARAVHWMHGNVELAQRTARTEIERLKELVDEFKAAAMLDVNGDPEGVTPRLLEGHVSALQTEGERLKTANAALAAENARLVNEVGASTKPEPAGVPRWRRELERLRLAPIQECAPYRLDALEKLAALAQVIESGRGQAVVPEGVAKALSIAPGTYTRRSPGVWMHAQHTDKADAAYLLAAINLYGDSLCGVPEQALAEPGTTESFRTPSEVPVDEGGGTHGA